MINGNIDGIKNSILEKLEELFEERVFKEQLLSEKIIDILCFCTNYIDREISVAIDRRGEIKDISIGDSSTVKMPQISIKQKRLSGVRIIHTHPNGNSRLSAIDLAALIKLKLDCMVSIGVLEGKLNGISVGFCDVYNYMMIPKTSLNLNLKEALNFNFLERVYEIEKLIKEVDDIDEEKERAVLVGIDDMEALDELTELAYACNVDVLQRFLQKNHKAEAATFIGSGKLEELSLICQATKANVVIFDDELSGSQARNIEEVLGVKVIDRTVLILEIFAKRAKSRESKIQVELAQLNYRYSRLIGFGTVLSRLGGGIGTRGPGETKLETDRRHIRNRIAELKEHLEKVSKNREVQRSSRSALPVVALVGYTNAGKSTLRNNFCEHYAPRDQRISDGVYVADMLFATLDTTSRMIVLEDSREALFIDTVGFIQKLPHELIEAFKSTLEEVVNASLLLHVVDSSSEYALNQIEAVDKVLEELKCTDKKQIILLNKLDIVDENRIEYLKGKLSNKKVLEISALNSYNFDKLIAMIQEELPESLMRLEFKIPYSRSDINAYIHENGKVLSEDFKEDGVLLSALVDNRLKNKFKEYILEV
ncbi:MAG: GTPase HflX [Oscillospiraceae bacterium]|nr:GTPase HflX [Oscillospiraceae bacterium]